MSGYVYILRDRSGKFYIGSTNVIARRLQQHRSRQNKTTKRMHEPRLVFQQEYETLALARKVELRLKKLKRKDYIEKIVVEGYIRLSE